MERDELRGFGAPHCEMDFGFSRRRVDGVHGATESQIEVDHVCGREP